MSKKYELYHGKCQDVLVVHDRIPVNSIDLIVTSPPYDNMRDYKGFDFNFEPTAFLLYEVLKPGGIMVWVVGDETVNYCESLTSFKQAIFFVERVGFNLLDTMIYYKNGGPPPFPGIMRYSPKFEYMFVFSKGKPKTFNPIKYKKKWINKRVSFQQRQKDGSFKHSWYQPSSDELTMDNVWMYDVGGGGKTAAEKYAYEHPAMFPEQLAEDHIKTWSNEGDMVLDPFMGSGTTGKMATLLNRNFIGIECCQEYFDIAEKRISTVNKMDEFFS